MATITLAYAKTLKEVAGNNGGIANTITFKAAGGTFAGDNGDVLGTVSGVPAGLNAVLVKTSATTAKLSFTGAATAHNNAAEAAANGTVVADNTQAITTETTTDATTGVAQVDTITLSGKYEAGDVITLGGLATADVTYTVLLADVGASDAATAEAVAAKLITAINSATGATGATVTAATFDGSAVDGKLTLTAKVPDTTGAFVTTATAANPAAAGGLKITFTSADFATGDLSSDLVVADIDFDFTEPAAAKTLTLVAPAGEGPSETYKAADLPTITGTAPDGVTKVYIYNNGGTKPIGDATVTANAWTFKLPTDKPKDGAYYLTASTSNDGKGAMTAGFAFTLDTKAPAAPSVNAIKGAISDTTPVLTGKAEKGATVEVFADKVSLGKTVADAKGAWTLAVENTVLVNNGVDKKFAISAKATDAAGNATDSKKDVELIIDTTIATPTLEATTVPKKNTVGLSGKVDGETGGSLQLYGGEDGSLALGKAIKIAKDGTWKSSVKLTDGKHLLSVIAIDAAGNVSDNSALKAVTIDTFTATPTVDLVKTGDVLTGLKGTAEAGATVKITIGTAKDKFTATADASGNWEVTDVSAFTVTKEAKLKITAIATDAATNVSKASTAVEHTFKVGGTPGGGTFTVTDTAGALAFGGTATGDITVTEASGALTFTRGGVAATTKPTISGLAADGIPTTATLVMTKAVFTAIDAKLANTAAVTLSDATGTIAAADLVTIGTNTATATLANSQTIDNAAASTAIAALATEATKVVMAAGKVATVDLFADSTFTAAELTSVYGAVGGTVIGTATDNITVITLNGATVAATESIDTFQFASGDVNVNITGFTSGTDKLNLNLLTAQTATTPITTGAMTTTADMVYILTGASAGAADSATAAAAAITAGATWASAAVTAYAIVVDNNSTAIYKWAEAGTDGAQAGELTLVGTIAATTVAGDYVFA